MNYEQKIIELEKLLSALENDEIPLHELSEKIELAFLQLSQLRAMLTEADTKVEAVLNMRNQEHFGSN
jgi:exodeoxyribonuclease VII small subunit